MCVCVCRMGGEQLSRSYCDSLADLIRHLCGPSPSSSSCSVLLLGSLWGRLMATLPPLVQLQVMANHTSCHVTHMDLRCLHPAALQSLSSTCLPSALQLLRAPNASPADVVCACACVHVCHESGCVCHVCE